jgi:hypothetical protein
MSASLDNVRLQLESSRSQGDWSHAMGRYHLYTLNSEGRIHTSADLEAEDDLEAVQLVRLRLEPADCELWCGRRKVAFCPCGRLPILLEDLFSS